MMTLIAPSSLYKYVAPDRARQLLAELRIRFSQVSVLNDADEFRPHYIGLAPRNELESQIPERFKLKHPDTYAQIFRTYPPQEAERLLGEKVHRWADTAEAKYEQSVSKVYETLDRNFGVLSLSATLTSKLMWSFYSDGGRGIAIEFDSHHPWFHSKKAENDSFRHLREVQYVEDRKPNYLLAVQEDAETKDNEALYTKTSEWQLKRNGALSGISTTPQKR